MVNSIPYNPVFFSYAIITPESASLYIDSGKIDSDVRSHLGSAVAIRPYESIFEEAESLSKSIANPTNNDGSDNQASKPNFLVSTKTSWALSQSLGGDKRVDEVRSPIGDAKAIKNDVEIKGMKECHVRDGAALIEFFAWLEEELVTMKAKIDEVQAADKLENIRS